MTSITLLNSAIALVTIALVSCATQETAVLAGKNVVACPECRVVVERIDDVYDSEANGTEVRRHECTGCQGRLETFLKEGKFEHRCTICANSPYGCQVRKAQVTNQR